MAHASLILIVLLTLHGMPSIALRPISILYFRKGELGRRDRAASAGSHRTYDSIVIFRISSSSTLRRVGPESLIWGPCMGLAVSSDLEPSARDAEPTRPWRRAASLTSRQLPLVIPPLIWAFPGWKERWLTDDGLIVARTVRQILAGNGPVFNPGERVEADTSTVWTWLVALITWATRLNVYTVLIWTGLLLAPLGLLFALLGAPRTAPAERAWAATAACRRRGRPRAPAVLGLRDLRPGGFARLLLARPVLVAADRPAARVAFADGLAGVYRRARLAGARRHGDRHRGVPRGPVVHRAPGLAARRPVAGDRRIRSGRVPGVPYGVLRAAGAEYRRRQGRVHPPSVLGYPVSREFHRALPAVDPDAPVARARGAHVAPPEPHRSRALRRGGRRRSAHGLVCHRDRRRLHARADAAAGDVRDAPAGHDASAPGVGRRTPDRRHRALRRRGRCVGGDLRDELATPAAGRRRPRPAGSPTSGPAGPSAPIRGIRTTYPGMCGR